MHALLIENGLGRYYELAGDRPAPAPAPPAPRSLAWLEPLLETATAGEGGLCALPLDVQGIHCSACVWLLEETFRRRPGSVAIQVNPAIGQVRLAWKRGALDPAAWVRDVEAFGYRFGPQRKRPSARSIDLPLRLGIAAALTLQVMLFSLSFHFGLAPAETEVFRAFSYLSLALSTGVALVGGWPFFRAALRGLKHGVLHLDLPIALGIVLVWTTSLLRMRGGRGDLAYFDSLDVFITLMLAGRLLQEHLLERNRRFLLEDDGAEGLMVRRIEGERVAVVAAARVRLGDRLLVAPSEVVPVDALLSPLGTEGAQVSTDWITGESAPLAVAPGARIAAGSFNAGGAAFEAVAATDFADSSLVALLRQPAALGGGRSRPRQLWDQVARVWVAAVAGLALAGLAIWLPRDPHQALAVAAALLVVTCPCAVGIAIPLAYELTLHRLRREGCFVRSDDCLDRLPRVRKILFDKTGTLTLGRLELAPEALAALATLAPETRRVVFNLAARSVHPASRALAAALARHAPGFDADAAVREIPGCGLEWRREDGLWRLGRAGWATCGAPGMEERVPGGLALGRDGGLVAALPLVEVPRPDAARELARLAARGYSIHWISGDEPARVAALAARLGVAAERVEGALSPEAKAEAVAALDADDTLYLGDGVNDAPAFRRAWVAGTPAIDRPVMPGRSDFFLVGEGLAPLAALLAGASRLRRLARRLLAIATLYNLGVVACALAGWVSPVVAAIVMPASTAALVTIAVLGLGGARDRGAGRAALPELAQPPLAEARP